MPFFGSCIITFKTIYEKLFVNSAYEAVLPGLIVQCFIHHLSKKKRETREKVKKKGEAALLSMSS
jgi:hypothetical protein